MLKSVYFIVVTVYCLLTLASPWRFWCGNLEVYKVAFYMGAFGSKTSKRTMVLTNNPAVCRLRLVRYRAKESSASNTPLCRKYVDKSGKAAFQGTKELKQSQTLGL